MEERPCSLAYVYMDSNPLDLLILGALLIVNTNRGSTCKKFLLFILAHDVIVNMFEIVMCLLVFPHTLTTPMTCLQYVICHNRLFSLLDNCDTIAFIHSTIILRLESDLILHSKL